MRKKLRAELIQNGSVYYDGEPVFDREAVKKRLFYLSDDPYFFPNATPQTMGELYRNLYEDFDLESYYGLLEKFELDRLRKLNTFSKGMKKQTCIFAGICAGTDYLLCDEVFDGLDPIVRQAVKGILEETVRERKLTVVIASHNLPELESICGQVGILYRGGVLLSKRVDGQSLEEIFAKETEAAGYNVKEFISQTATGGL